MQENTLSGTIERVTFHNEENGYCVLRVRPNKKGDMVTVVGNCAAPNAGEQIASRGQWIKDEQYGNREDPPRHDADGYAHVKFFEFTSSFN